LPPFFIPILAFALWFVLILVSLPVLRLDLHLSDQFAAVLFFVSHLILVFAWPLSGPGAAAVLSGLAALVAVYLSLSAREPAYFLQALLDAALFVYMAFYLYKVQQGFKDRQISREKMAEELHMSRKAVVKNVELQTAFKLKIDRFLDLQRFSEELKGMRTLEEAAERVVREAREVLAKADGCVLFLVDETRQELYRVAGGDVDVAGHPSGRVFDQWVMKRSQAIMIDDTTADFRFTADAAPGAERIRSVCASPLMTGNKVLGVVRAHSSARGRFSTDDLRLLDVFSSFGAVTLRNLLLHDTMRELATRDSLTGLYVNRCFREMLEEEIRKADYLKRPFAIVLLDIDHFKRYNDEYGHSAGDLVLRNIGTLLQKGIGPAEFAARYGGEEFVLLLPGSGRKEAAATAEKLRRQIERSVIVLRRVERHVTASFGVSVYPENGRTKEDLLWAADKHLYEAKNAGRNRVCGGT
jgi:diguanylate cyclase (GGDEF)-like protein